MSNWTIFSNHGHVLFCLARDSGARLRDVATDVGLTERAVQKIVRDLQQSGMIIVTKHGRRNRYRIDDRKPLRHDLEAHCTLDALVSLIVSPSGGKAKPPATRPVAEKPASVAPSTARPVATEPDKPAITKSSARAGKPEEAKKKGSGQTERQQGSLF